MIIILSTNLLMWLNQLSKLLEVLEKMSEIRLLRLWRLCTRNFLCAWRPDNTYRWLARTTSRTSSSLSWTDKGLLVSFKVGQTVISKLTWFAHLTGKVVMLKTLGCALLQLAHPHGLFQFLREDLVELHPTPLNDLSLDLCWCFFMSNQEITL